MSLSVIVPVYNEEGNIKVLCNEICDHLDREELIYEVIFVNDCSSDGSLAELGSLTKSNVRVISSEKNVGQGKSILAGAQKAAYSTLVTLDADLQNVPCDIFKLLRLKEVDKLDMVIGRRNIRKDSLLKRVQSRVGNSIFKKLFGHAVNDIGCGIKVFDKSILDEICFKYNVHRYLPILFHIHGYKIAELAVKHRSRGAGKSKYGLKRSLEVIRDSYLLLLYKSRMQSNYRI